MIGYILNSKGSGKESTLISKEDFLGEISVEFSMMEVPAIQLTLPIRYSKLISGNTHIVLQTDDWKYEGYAGDKSNDFNNMTVTVKTSHVIGRLGKRTLPTNVTVKARSVVSAVNKLWGTGLMKLTRMTYLMTLKLSI